MPRPGRAKATRSAFSLSPSGLRPKTCSPSRICSSFNSQRNPSSLPSAAAVSSPAVMPQSPSSPAARACSRIAEASTASRRESPQRGLVVFVDQPFELGHRPVTAGAGQRRRQVVDDHRLSPPLGLRALAGIVDDERIEMRQRPEHRLREAFGGQSQRLPRQPFERAVLAEMNDGVGTKLLGEPGIYREIAVRRHQSRIVIGRFRVDVVAARRLDQHRDIAGAKAGNREAAAIEPARAGKMDRARRRPSDPLPPAAQPAGRVAKKAE